MSRVKFEGAKGIKPPRRSLPLVFLVGERSRRPRADLPARDDRADAVGSIPWYDGRVGPPSDRGRPGPSVPRRLAATAVRSSASARGEEIDAIHLRRGGGRRAVGRTVPREGRRVARPAPRAWAAPPRLAPAARLHPGPFRGGGAHLPAVQEAARRGRRRDPAGDRDALPDGGG